MRQGGAIPLFMTIGRVSDAPDRKLCAVLRDITAFKKAEGELVGARRAAEQANAQKSDLLATFDSRAEPALLPQVEGKDQFRIERGLRRHALLDDQHNAQRV